MTTVSDLTTIQYSGDLRVDSLLADPAVWNYLIPERNRIYYTFDASTGSAIDLETARPVTGFNLVQRQAATQILAYAGSITGIEFVEVATSAEADLHFGAYDLEGSAAGLWSSPWSVSTLPDGTLISLDTESYVYLDNAESAAYNEAPVAGEPGYEVLLHEIGHALGLDHPFDAPYPLPFGEDNTDNTVMSYTHTGLVKSTFQPYDLLALQWIYGGDGLGGDWGYGSTNGPSLLPLPLPGLAITATIASSAEGDAGATTFSFTVTRSGDLSGPSSVHWSVSSASADAADFGGTLPSGSVNFAAGSGSESITVLVSGDTAVESDEPFTVTLSDPNGATLAVASAEGLIVNDDMAAVATNGDDALVGSEGDDTIEGLGGDDTLDGASGNDSLDGGEGLDTAVLGGAFADFDWRLLLDGDDRVLEATRAGGPNEVDRLRDIELLRLSDRTVEVEDLIRGEDTIHTLFNQRTGQTLYTADLVESGAWADDPDIVPLAFEYAAPLAFGDGVVPVFRVYSSTYDLFLWTADAAFRDEILATPGIEVEDQGVAFHAYASDDGGAVPIHMVWDWNPSATYPGTAAPLNILYADAPWLPLLLDGPGEPTPIDMGIVFWL